MTGRPRVVPVREGSIRLGQFLKLADIIDNGSEARPMLADGLVSVNGEVEVRRGRQLVVGDVVTVRMPHLGETVTAEVGSP
jgi:ribosome-associated protein